jgi:hypothetical protein
VTGPWRKPRKWNIPLTYEPKIPGVIDGTIQQTIRVGRKFRVGDLVSFHGWEGRPYRSKWSFRTPYFTLTMARAIRIVPGGIVVPPRPLHEEYYAWRALDDLAARDGIEPPTGEALRDVLLGMHTDPRRRYRSADFEVAGGEVVTDRSYSLQYDLENSPKVKALTEQAIARLRKHEPPEDGYYLAFSGGKDSIVIYDLAVRSGVKFDAHFQQTTVDPPEVLRFIREHYPDVAWTKPKRSMFQMIVDHGTPPTRIIRYCCSELKELHGSGRVVVLGVRWAESARRRNRPVYGESTRRAGTYFLSPIVDWTTADVWDYILISKPSVLFALR